MHSTVAPIKNSALIVCPGTITRHAIVSSVCRHDSITVTEAGSLLKVSLCHGFTNQVNVPCLTS